MHLLPDWKIRHRIRLCGNSIHITDKHNNRHWDEHARDWKPNTEVLRAQEDLVWIDLTYWVYGTITIFGSRFATKAGPSLEMWQEGLKIVKCFPDMSDFLRRRLESTHRTHLRHTLCIQNIWEREAKKWSRQRARAAKSGVVDARLRENWEKPLLQNVTVTAFVLIPDQFPGQDFENIEPVAAAPYQPVGQGMQVTIKFTELFTLDRFLRELFKKVYETNNIDRRKPSPRRLHLYTGSLNRYGIPQIPYSKQEIKNDYDFYSYTTKHEDCRHQSPEHGFWFKVIMHPETEHETLRDVSIRLPLQRYPNYPSYVRNTRVIFASQNGAKRAADGRAVRKDSVTWIDEGNPPRTRNEENPREPKNTIIEDMVESASEPDSENEGPPGFGVKQLLWLWERDIFIHVDEESCREPTPPPLPPAAPPQ